MFNEALTDPTAGGRARRVRLHPELPQPILDPTDPRYGADLTRAGADRADESRRDPTDSRQGEQI